MNYSAISLGLAAALVLAGCGASDTSTKSVSSIEFIGMDAPSTAIERASVYSAAMVTVNYSDDSSSSEPLEYKQLYATTDSINGVTAGGLYDVVGQPLIDYSVPGNPSQYVTNTPDANSLLKVENADAAALGVNGNPLFMVTHFEYVSANNNGDSEYGQLPMTMGLTTIDQNKNSGELAVVDYSNIDMSAIKGLWIPCAGSLSPWNTHLGSEEYEPNARAYELNNLNAPYTPFTQQYYNSSVTANPYDYGHVPEVTVSADGGTSVVKHYAMGRIAREMVAMMPDQRTAYMGDDGGYTGLFMFVADTAADLSAGDLYAAKWTQTSAANVGSADISWIKLGHASDAEIKTLVSGGIQFSDIFLASSTDPADATYSKVRTNNGVEWLKLNAGMEQAAAFLETRRYAAYLGATTEFNKMEGVAINAADNKLYIAMSYVEKGMVTAYSATDPVDDIQISKLSSGAVYQLSLSSAQNDSSSNAIDSSYVVTDMSGLVWGEDQIADAAGNISNDDKVANPDNINFSEKMRTLFIGEDSGRHVNNYVWAYNVDNGSLARILSTPAGAEATGLQPVDNLNGFAYVMSNFQHPGDFIKTMDVTLKNEVAPLVDSLWQNKKKAGIGYLSGIPAVQ